MITSRPSLRPVRRAAALTAVVPLLAMTACSLRGGTASGAARSSPRGTSAGSNPSPGGGPLGFLVSTAPNDSEYGRSGPHPVATASDDVTEFFYPADIARSGRTHAVILWGNGTGTAPWIYGTLLRHWASHGFIVAAAKTSNAGTGREMLQGLDTLTRRNGQAGDPFHNKVNLAKVGASGHSQGGFGAVSTARDNRVTTVFPIEGPGMPAGNGPVLILNAQNGMGPAMGNALFGRLTHRPAALVEMAGADHITPIGDGNWFRVPSTAWVTWHLDGDTKARGLFAGPDCGLCDNPVWSRYEANARLTGAPS